MASLWEIDSAIMECLDSETGEILDEEKLESLHLEREEKLEKLCKWVKNLEADVEMFKAYKMDFAAKQKTAENTLFSVKKYLQNYLSGEKWEAKNKSVKIAYRTSRNKVVVDDVNLIPDQFFKYEKKESLLNKTAIKDSILETGEMIDGVHLEDSVLISVK